MVVEETIEYLSRPKVNSPHMLADYLEERWPICPELALHAMRGWVAPKPKKKK